MAILYEYRPDLVRMGELRLETKKGLSTKTGFRSLFGYPDKTGKYVEALGATRGLADKELYADVLFLDFDDAEQAFIDAEKILMREKIDFCSYHTGNRGYHIHIRIEPERGLGLPTWMKEVVKTYFKGADLGIYKPSGIIRLPGTVHKKTGKTKKLIRYNPGRKLKLPEELQSKVVSWVPGTAQKREYSPAETVAFLLSNGAHVSGGRNNHCFKLAKNLQEQGLAMSQVISTCERWNNMLTMPLKPQEIITVVRSAFRS